jgi:acetyl esterase/lipase
MPQSTPFTLHGPLAYRLKSLATLTGATFRVTLRRLLRGPRLPSWDTNFEITIEFLRAQGQHAHRLPTPAESRAYEDSFLFAIPALEQVKLTPVTSPVRGHWYDPRAGTPPGRTLLYLHGGGYTFYAKGHASLISLTALAARARTFALDYRLAPEHPYPAALDDARAAYGWLLDQGVSLQNLTPEIRRAET